MIQNDNYSLSSLELANANIAVDLVKNNGGFISFDEYDKQMFTKLYFTPFNWTAGWGLPNDIGKRNMDKLCAFKACQIGKLEQTIDGYKIKNQEVM